MDLRKRAAESILSAMVELPRSGSGSEVAALERLIADVESGPARRDVRNADPSAQEDTVARAKQHDQ